MSSPSRPLLHWLPSTPRVETFALIAGIEALVRGGMLSVFPLLLYRAWGSAAVVSEIYFAIGLLSLLMALTVPALTRRIPRRRVYLGAIILYTVSAVFGAMGGKMVTLALLCHASAAATSFVCFNAYVLDHVDRSDFSRLETLRLLYSGLGWVIGPALGVWLLSLWSPAPFLLVAIAALSMQLVVWQVSLGNGRSISRPRPRAAHPLANVQRFMAQPRLVAGWFLALMRSSGWWFYFVYVGIYAVENGLGDKVGGVAASVANLGLFLAPLMFRWMQKNSVRIAVRTGTLCGGICFLLGSLLWQWPWLALAMLVLGTLFLVLLDVAANLPFMMAVKPSERTEMSSVFSSFRDASGILSPAIAWAVLLVSPVAGVFAAGGLGLMAAWAVAGRMHPQLGLSGAARAQSRRVRPLD
jgi:ACDE family multidrug resistance protein